MKKSFELNHPKLKPQRWLDAIKHELKKYIKRERNKKLPAESDFWAFDCKVGVSEDTADVVHIGAINKAIDAISASESNTLYVEIIAHAAVTDRTPRSSDYDEAEG